MTPPAPWPPAPRLDWSGSDGVQHWGGGMLRTCRTCHRPAFLLDDAGRPQHKTCAEAEAAATPPAAEALNLIRPAAARLTDWLTSPETDRPALEAEALG